MPAAAREKLLPHNKPYYSILSYNKPCENVFLKTLQERETREPCVGANTNM